MENENEELSDIELVQEFMKCSHERAIELIQNGINVDFIRSKGDGLFDKAIDEAKTNFFSKILDIKKEMDN